MAKKKKKKKLPRVITLKRKADRSLSLYIRAITEKRTGPLCPLCGVNPIECSFHFIKRQRAIVRWNEDNVVGACSSCNWYERRIPDPSRAWFIRNRGADLYLRLVDRSMNDFKPNTPDYREFLLEAIERYDHKLVLLKENF